MNNVLNTVIEVNVDFINQLRRAHSMAIVGMIDNEEKTDFFKSAQEELDGFESVMYKLVGFKRQGFDYKKPGQIKVHKKPVAADVKSLLSELRSKIASFNGFMVSKDWKVVNPKNNTILQPSGIEMTYFENSLTHIDKLINLFE